MNLADKKPEWLKISPDSNTDFSKIKNALRKRGLVTVCEESHCPNMAECWHNQGTATLMIMGDTCTRGCSFCAIKTALKGNSLDPFEPIKIAESIKEMQLGYVVLTSVDRDDLIDGGASHFAQVIARIRKTSPLTKIEVLIPDFAGNLDALKKIVDAKPDVIAHNVETVKRLQKKVRDRRANYMQSLKVLKNVKKLNSKILTKSSIMVGLGEENEEINQTLKDLRNIDCDIVTFGQYLKPKNKVLKVEEYIHPKIFKEYEINAKKLGFIFVASGPHVRSSYKAGELFINKFIDNNK